MLTSIRRQIASLGMMVACGLVAAAPEGRDLAALVAAEQQQRKIHEAEGTPAARLAWVSSLAQLAWIHAEEGRDPEALLPYRKAIAELPDHAMREDPEFVALLHDGLGRALQNCGEYEEAEVQLTKGLQIRTEIPDAEVRVGLSEGHLGLLQLVRGRYANAERLFHSALRHTPEDRHDLLALRHDCLGRYYLAVRAYQLATDAYEVAIKHGSIGIEADDSYLLDLRAAFALCRLRGGDAEGALGEIADLLEIKSDRPEAPLRRADLLNLGATILAEESRFQDAGRALEEALEIVTAIKGAGHPALAQFLANLGAFRLQAGQPTEALAPLQESETILAAAVDDHHQALVEVRYLIADCRLELNDPNKAREAVLAARRTADLLLTELTGSGSERELLNFRAQVDLHSIVCQLGEAGLIAQSLLDGKGRIMEAVLERRAGAEENNKELEALRLQLDQLRLKSPVRSADRIGQLRTKIRELSGELRPVAEPKGITWRELRGRLSEQTVFVDCVRYRPRGEKAGRYGAVVIAPRREPVWVPLAEEKKMDRLDLLHRSLKIRGDSIGKGGEEGGTPMVPLLTLLHGDFWAPIAKAIPEGTEKIVMCPEGRMHLLPYAVLNNSNGGFLCEEIPALHLVNSGRAFFHGDSAPEAKGRGWVALGVSDFAPYREGVAGGSARWPEHWAKELRVMKDLEVVKEELNALRSLAPEESRFLVNDRAVLSALRGLPAAPEILHFASHGFHVSSGGSAEVAGDPSALYENGVVLGLAPGDDGILFPEEVATLNLHGTKLVTLSTCRSALGRPVSGEGVLGLSRGFSKAGARSILASLWQIPDRSTADFMKRYYTAIAAGEDPGKALWRMQAEYFRAPRQAALDRGEIETAILQVGGFVLGSTGG